jgi:carbamoyltransferase
MNNILPEETIAINGSHDCACTFIDKNKKLRIYEYERFVKKRYAMFSKGLEKHRSSLGTNDKNREDFLNYIKKNLYCEDIKLVLYHDMFSNEDLLLFKKYFPNADLKYCNHHISHAYGAFHLSGFKDCLIFSVDGGGRDDGIISTTNVYLYNENEMKHISKPNIDVGNPYNFTAMPLSELGGQGVAGKLMGLTAYGNVRSEWLEIFRKFYFTKDNDYLLYSLNVHPKSLKGQVAWDIAKTSQYVFEEILFDLVKVNVEKYNLNVVMTGGCALNVLFNQRLYEYLKTKNLELYVPPNPNDCGLSFGMFTNEHKNAVTKEEICFSGFEILDENEIQNYDNPSEELDLKKLITYLKDGKIIAIIDGYSEAGPRALGNRSIICYPAFPEMKDILNSKVKFREWFRPFAPVCKIEDKDVFFENAPDCKYMSFAPKVKETWRTKLPSITHADNTSRLQTVSNDCFFYEILTEMSNQSLIPVLLNTSFNIKGLPILTTLKDAFHVLNNTDLDILIHKNRIYKKK